MKICRIKGQKRIFLKNEPLIGTTGQPPNVQLSGGTSFFENTALRKKKSWFSTDFNLPIRLYTCVNPIVDSAII